MRACRRPAAAAKASGRAVFRQRPRRCVRVHRASVAVMPVEAVRVNAKRTREMLGRARLSATIAPQVRASAEILGTRTAGAVGPRAGAGPGLGPGEGVPAPPAGAPPEPGAGSLVAPSPGTGGWKAASPFGAPTPLGPS